MTRELAVLQSRKVNRIFTDTDTKVNPKITLSGHQLYAQTMTFL